MFVIVVLYLEVNTSFKRDVSREFDESSVFSVKLSTLTNVHAPPCYLKYKRTAESIDHLATKPHGDLSRY